MVRALGYGVGACTCRTAALSFQYLCRQDVSDIDTPSSGTSVSKVSLEPVRDAGSCYYIIVSTSSMAEAEDPPSCPSLPVPTRHVVMASPEHDIPHWRTSACTHSSLRASTIAQGSMQPIVSCTYASMLVLTQNSRVPWPTAVAITAFIPSVPTQVQPFLRGPGYSR